MRPTLLVFRREFAAYFATPVAAITNGPGNPMANSRVCPATAGGS